MAPNPDYSSEMRMDDHSTNYKFRNRNGPMLASKKPRIRSRRSLPMHRVSKRNPKISWVKWPRYPSPASSSCGVAIMVANAEVW